MFVFAVMFSCSVALWIRALTPPFLVLHSLFVSNRAVHFAVQQSAGGDCAVSAGADASVARAADRQFVLFADQRLCVPAAAVGAAVPDAVPGVWLPAHVPLGDLQSHLCVRSSMRA